jgi:1-acyl-sn-glycerol-3-phosphate acyltransferase
MGLQSAFFGPSKYSILPQLLPDQGDLVGGNALIEMGTYFSVLGGIALATGMIGLDGGLWWFAVAVVVIAVLGYLVSRWMPTVAAESPDLVVAKEPFTSTWDAARVLLKDVPILQSVFGISWFWALGGGLLVLFATYAKDVLHGTPPVYASLMGLFAVGIGVGSLATERLSFGRLEIGLVPIGSLGLSLGLVGLFLIGEPWPAGPDGALLGLVEVMTRPMWWVLVADVLLLSASGGFFMVPLYTLVQHRSPPAERSRIIGANNIVNSFFILLVQGALLGFAFAGIAEPTVFGVLAIVNICVAVYIYLQVPEFTLRFLAWVLSNVAYRLQVTGLDQVPDKGPVLIICNHVSFIDFLVVMGAIRRPARFVMDAQMSRIPGLSLLFRQAKVIPITSYKADPAMVEQAMERVHEELQQGRAVVVFPEGGLTWDGQMLPFKSGIERILARDPVPVVPMALNGLWGSFFSRKGGPAMTRPLRRGAWNRIWLSIGEPVVPDGLTAELARERVLAMWSEKPDHP